MKNKITPKIIDYIKDRNFQCMYEDTKLLNNLIEQKTRGHKKETDYIQPGLLSGQSLNSVLREIVKSINNHLDYFDKENIYLF